MAYYNYINWYMLFFISPIICGIAVSILFVLQDPSRYCTSFLDCSRWASLFLLPPLLCLYLKEKGVHFRSASPSPAPPPDLSLTASDVVPERKYDVFVSFRGADIRPNFLSHLLQALSEKKIETFVDYKLREGDEISPTLVRAILESEISLVVFSKDYASSKWCLEELAKIIECMEDHNQIVIPVFYHIDPSSVRRQTGCYKNAFVKHEMRLKHDKAKLQKWRSALEKAADLSGFHSSNHKTEAELIKKVVECLLTRLNQTSDQSDLNGLVGMQDHIAHIEALLPKRSQGVFIIGIWGMGGIGKTTIAEVLFDRLCHKYEGSEFLHVREELEKNGITKLKRKLLSNLLDDELPIFARNGIPPYVKKRLLRKKTLVVLDDIDDPKQLKILIGGHEWVGPGSIIIVTSRYKHMFSKDCDEIYEVEPLNFEASLQLFNLHAFAEGSLEKEQDYYELSMKVVEYTKGIPLAIKVLGSFLYDKNKIEWESELKKLENMPCPEIQDVLKLSYDGLDDEQKDIFLYLACFFRTESKERITFLLDACDYHTTIGLRVLLDKALITISKLGLVSMHELIQDMGREVVCEKSRKNPSNRNHLWDPDDIDKVLSNNMGTQTIKSISLDMSRLKKDIQLNPRAFVGMENLKFLEFRYWMSQNRFLVHAPDIGFDSLSKELRYLHWDAYPSASFPLRFRAEKLVELSMPRSGLQRLWDGTQELPSLKNIILVNSRKLTELPDLSKAPNLERIYLTGCIKFRHLPVLTNNKLVELYLHDCHELRSLGSHSISKPRDSHAREKHDHLIFRETASCVQEFLSSISTGHSNNNNIEQPNEVFNGLESLQILAMGNCNKVVALPDNIGLLPSLRSLQLCNCNIEVLPESIKHLSQLIDLALNNCKRLRSIPELPPSIEKLYAFDCTSLETIRFSPRLMSLSLQKYGLEFSFNNCVKLDEDSIVAIVEHYQLRTQKLLSSNSRDNYSGVYFPGSKFPDCLNSFGAAESSNTVSLELALNSKVMGIIFYVVLRPLDKTNIRIQLKCHMEVSSGGKVHISNGPHLNLLETISDHVYFWYDGSLSLDMTREVLKSEFLGMDLCPKVWFEIIVIPSECQSNIIEWGVCPIYAF